MHELSKLFGTELRVKILRLFLYNSGVSFSNLDISKKLKVKEDISRKELQMLEKIFFIFKEKGGKENAYRLNEDFRFRTSLKNFLFDFQSADRENLKERFLDIGRIKLLMLSGVFVGQQNSRCDILYVGEAIKITQKDKLLAEFEAEVGYKLRIEILDLDEYNYRYKMFDRFLRDALSVDNNEFIVDKLSVTR
jgi:hypothetical protein